MHKIIPGVMTVALCVIAFDASARFVSGDPVQVDPNTGANFNRYYYANNNPYKFTDPDGRAAQIVYGQDGSITVQLPTRFTGAGATPGNIHIVTSGFQSQSDIYQVGGQPTQVNFMVVPITGDTPAGLQNTMTLTPGKTDHPRGVSYADAVGGTHAAVNTTSQGFQHGAGHHELNHLAGAEDAYLRGPNGEKVPDPARAGDIMNQVPGSMTETAISEILRHPNNERMGTPQ